MQRFVAADAVGEIGAERKGMSWLMLPFAVTGAWASGLGLLAAYAAGSFFWAQREVHRAPAAPED